MPVFTAFITLGLGIFAGISGAEDQAFKKELADETIKFGEKELSQQNDQFLATLGLTKEDLALKQEAFGFQKGEASKDRIEREKDRKIKQRQFGTQAALNLFGAQTGLQDRMLSMWNNTGFFGGGQAGTPPATNQPAPAPAGQGVFSGVN